MARSMRSRVRPSQDNRRGVIHEMIAEVLTRRPHLANVAGVIPKLYKEYSSRMYKEWLKEKRIHRIPHYLARVETPSPKQVSS